MRKVLILFATLSIVVGACSRPRASSSPIGQRDHRGGDADRARRTAPSASAADVRRTRAHETLYTSGKQYGAPSTWNPLDPNAAMGTVGLQYETLFLYHPTRTSSSRGSPRARRGRARRSTRSRSARASSGPTARPSRPTTWPSRSASPRSRPSAPTSGTTSRMPRRPMHSTVVVKFKDPAYQEWATWTYNSPIVPKHIWEAKANEDILKDNQRQRRRDRPVHVQDPCG